MPTREKSARVCAGIPRDRRDGAAGRELALRSCHLPLPPSPLPGPGRPSPPLGLTDALLKHNCHTLLASRLGDFLAFIVPRWECPGRKGRTGPQGGRLGAGWKPPAAGPRLGGGGTVPAAGVWMETSQTALCGPAGDLGRPVRCRAHTPTGLRAVRLVPKANTELIFPAYSFHVWAASGFAGSLGSLLPALPKPPAPSTSLAPGGLFPLHSDPKTLFRFT